MEDIVVRADGEGSRDRDEVACRSLWAAVIHKAVKDVAYVDAKRRQDGLTPSEREKIHRIYELDTPESFFHGPWFEEICRYLELPAARIRNRVLDRHTAL
jgi:hypothetical protein